MNKEPASTPFSRMSGWDIPHVPRPSAVPAPADQSAPPAPLESEAPESIPEVGQPASSAADEVEQPLPPPADNTPAGDMAQVRFLNAAMGGNALRITLGNQLLSPALTFGTLTGYFSTAAGFRPLVLYDAQSPWMIRFRTSLPLSPGDRVTFAVIPSAAGLDLVRVDDRPHTARGTDRACIRCIDLIHNCPGLDLILTDGRIVFTDMRFKEVTTCRRAVPGRYDLYVARTHSSARADIETVEEMPVNVQGRFFPGGGAEPLASFFLHTRAGVTADLFLLGSWEPIPRVEVRMVENF